MSEERRKHKRLDLEVAIKLQSLCEEDITVEKFLHVDVINMSKTGIGFRSGHELAIGSCYDTKISIWTKEEIHTVIKIVRCNKLEDKYEYGCIFSGLPETEAIKIDIYQMFDEQNN